VLASHASVTVSATAGDGEEHDECEGEPHETEEAGGSRTSHDTRDVRATPVPSPCAQPRTRSKRAANRPEEARALAAPGGDYRFVSAILGPGGGPPAGTAELHSSSSSSTPAERSLMPSVCRISRSLSCRASDSPSPCRPAANWPSRASLPRRAKSGRGATRSAATRRSRSGTATAPSRSRHRPTASSTCGPSASPRRPAMRPPRNC
jgi:hypothetical protein